MLLPEIYQEEWNRFIKALENLSVSPKMSEDVRVKSKALLLLIEMGYKDILNIEDMQKIAKHIAEETDINSRRKTEALQSYSQLVQAKYKIIEGMAKMLKLTKDEEQNTEINIVINRVEPKLETIEDYLEVIPEGEL